MSNIFINFVQQSILHTHAQHYAKKLLRAVACMQGFLYCALQTQETKLLSNNK